MTPKAILVLLFLWTSAIGLNTVTCAAPPSGDDAATTEPDRVQPGKVHWHEDFPAACAAAQQSDKPVLLFQLLGQLDAVDT